MNVLIFHFERSGADVKNNFYPIVVMPYFNKSLWLDVPSKHSFFSQSVCIISALLSYAMLKYVCDIGSRCSEKRINIIHEWAERKKSMMNCGWTKSRTKIIILMRFLERDIVSVYWIRFLIHKFKLNLGIGLNRTRKLVPLDDLEVLGICQAPNWKLIKCCKSFMR